MKTGNLKPTEVRPLIMAARKAYDLQLDLGNLDASESFDAWRREQVTAVTGKPGLTACHHWDYLPLMAHFQTLSGDSDKAFKNLLRHGSPTSKAAAGDTHELRRNLAHEIMSTLEKHMAEGGKLTVGYLVYIARQKTRRPTLTLGQDVKAGLADRLTVAQLIQLRNTLVNRINASNGVGDKANRNKSQRKS